MRATLPFDELRVGPPFASAAPATPRRRTEGPPRIGGETLQHVSLPGGSPIRPQTRHPLAVALLFAAVATNCTILGLDECGEPTRNLIVVWWEGPMPATAQSIHGQVTLYQVKGEPMRGSWTVSAHDLRARITRVELREGGTLVASLPLAVGPIPAGPISVGENFPGAIRVPLDDAWSSLAAGRVALELETNLPDRPLIRLSPPSSRNATGYQRPSCGT